MKPFMPNLSLHRVALVFVLLAAAGGTMLADSTTFVSDDFNTRNLKRPLWTFVDPKNDATIQALNTGTDSASIAITVPSTDIHDIDRDGYYVPRIVQNATNTDFRLEVKFLSGVVGNSNAAYQVQGIVVEQNTSSLIRFDFTTSSSAPTFRIFAQSFIGGFSSGGTIQVNQEIGPNGAKPLWMRVDRVGDNWTQSYSLDGVAWTVAGSFNQPLVVSRVGAFVGNDGLQPTTTTTVIDYFRNLDNPGAAEDSLTDPPDDIAPLIHSVKVMRASTNAMEVRWRTDEPSTGVLEYGATPAYGSSVVVSTPATEHTVLLTGLQPGIMYDYKVTATDNSANSSSTGNNEGGTEAVRNDVASVSDDFYGSELDGALWAQVNPLGDGSYAVSGGELTIGVPGGVAHDIWTTGARAPRIMQPLTNANLISVEAKFVTGVAGSSSSNQFQGFLFEEDQNNAVRIDFLGVATGTRVFAAAFVGGYVNTAVLLNTNILPSGASPLFLRVTQDGASWIVEYSIDGISWTQAGSFWHFQRTKAVGVYAGNAGSIPATFASRIEYFKAARPARVALATPANGAIDLTSTPTLGWGQGLQASAYHVQVAADDQFNSTVFSDTNVAGTTRVASGLAFSTRYYWRVRGKNASGYGAYSDVWNFTTRTSSPDVPNLVSPANGATGQPTSLTLVWNRIQNATSYRVQVSTENTFTTGLLVDDPAIIDTSKALASLALGTTYYWRVNASSPGGSSDYSSTYSFTTVASIPDAVTLLTPENGASVSAAIAQFTWQAAPTATKYWHELAVDPLFQFNITDSSLTGTSKTLTGLVANQTYYWRVRAGNISGWGPYSEARTFTAIIVGVNDDRGIPTAFGLSQNYPNPFNPATTIEFAVPHEARVTIDVYNALGEQVVRLLDEPRAAGYHTVSFDASSLPSGLYLYRFSAGDFTSVRKMVLMK